MSHELQTPMNAILGFAQMLKYSPKDLLSEKQEAYVNNILQGGGYLMELINQLPELSKVETGQVTLNILEVSARDIIDGCLIMISERADKDGIDVADQTASYDLPTLWTDRTRLAQVLLNLLSNAVKYSREGGTVTLTCEEFPDHMLRISIADTGKGIPAAKHCDLFKPVDRQRRKAKNTEGSGIGLTIAKETIGLLGGEIGFESLEDEGSTFWVDVPMKRKQVDIRVLSNRTGGTTGAPKI